MFLSIPLIPAVLSIQPCLEFSILFSPDTVSNSEMKVSGQVDNDVTWVWIRIEKEILGGELSISSNRNCIFALAQANIKSP